jgi:hypothetical protein
MVLPQGTSPPFSLLWVHVPTGCTTDFFPLRPSTALVGCGSADCPPGMFFPSPGHRTAGVSAAPPAHGACAGAPASTSRHPVVSEARGRPRRRKRAVPDCSDRLFAVCPRACLPGERAPQGAPPGEYRGLAPGLPALAMRAPCQGIIPRRPGWTSLATSMPNALAGRGAGPRAAGTL